MSEHRHVTEPGELVYAPKPSWAPVFFAIGVLGLVCGTYASGFIFAPYIYAVIGAVFALAAFRGLVRSAIRSYYALPRKQRVRGAALPVETISTPPKP
ncbi:MAG TPA: hypothetical protein VFX85_04535 [Solirubrobacterales bacterium]|nr:hypothetical protein [Solirubrobacterales bacterium]